MNALRRPSPQGLLSEPIAAAFANYRHFRRHVEVSFGLPVTTSSWQGLVLNPDFCFPCLIQDVKQLALTGKISKTG
jgi:hypothetical protein